MKKGQVQQDLMADSAKLAALSRKTRDLKHAVEKALGARLGRRINIQGEINNVI